MNTLIIDRFACQPVYRRLLWTVLTGVGWLFWMSLWLPLLKLPQVLVGEISSGDLIASPVFGQVLATLGSHAALILAAIGLFLAWSLFQSHADSERSAADGRSPTSVRQLAQSVRVGEQDLRAWQQAQRMVVVHDENLGWIREIRGLENQQSLTGSDQIAMQLLNPVRAAPSHR